jgi:D-amino-acid dehydrogenase
MQVAVIGAGVIGITTAYELARDGHEVTVFERCSSVAAETSFANAGVIAPGYVTPWAAPGMPMKVLGHLMERHAPVRLGAAPDLATLRWIWRWWRQCSPARYRRNRARMHRLAAYSRMRLRALTDILALSYEQRRGYVVLLRTRKDLAAARPALAMLEELGTRHEVLQGDDCYRVEPGMSRDTPLTAVIHLPDDGLGNCRQFAHLMKAKAEELKVSFRFNTRVLGLLPGRQPQVRHRPEAAGAAVNGALPAPGADSFDAVVLCAALGAAPLLRPLGLSLPLAAVHGYSLTAPLREIELHPDLGPRAALMDERYKVAISRLGSRVRVAGSAELGGELGHMNEDAIGTLHKVLHDWFPGAARMEQVQTWKGARPMLPDGPPVLGDSGIEGLWLNLGHGSSGWALACGSAKLLADMMAGRAPDIDIEGLGVDRFVRRRRA